MLNRALLVGRLTRDPELRRTGSGKAVTSFNLAVERNFKSDDQEADFINCVCWGKIAENTERYCSKGSLVSVDGLYSLLIQREIVIQPLHHKRKPIVICIMNQFSSLRMKA